MALCGTLVGCRGDVLDLGARREGFLDPSTSRSYSIDLARDEYVYLEVEQRGVDVVVTLFDPAGQRLIVADYLQGSGGAEWLAAVTRNSGRHRLEIRPYRGQGGAYAVSLVERCPATQEHRAQARAEKAQAVAMVDYRDDEEEARRRVAQQLIESSQLWLLAEKPSRAADALNTAATIFRRLSEMPRAMELYREALRLHRTTDSAAGQAVVLKNMGIVYWASGEIQTAKECYEEALKHAARAADPRLEASVLHSLSGIYRRLGRTDEAFEKLIKAWRLRQVARDDRGQVATLLRLGSFYNERGRPEDATAYLYRALRLAEALEDSDLTGTALHNLAAGYETRGELQEALIIYGEALVLHDRTGNRGGQASVLHSLALLNERLGRLDLAQTQFQRALELRREMSEGKQEAQLLNLLGRFHHRRGHREEALDYLGRALERSREVQDRPEEATALFGLGQVLASGGDWGGAVESLRQALEIQGLRSRGPTLTRLGNALRHSGDLPLARRRLEEALVIHRRVGSRAWEASTLLALADLERARGRLAMARRQAEAAIEIVESVRSKVISHDLRSSFFSRQRDHYELLIQIYMDLHRRDPEGGYDALAFAVSERSLARSLREILEESRRGIRRGVAAELRDREAELKGRINSREALRLSLKSAEPESGDVALVEQEIEGLLEELRVLEAEIRTRSPRYAELSHPESLDLPQIQERVLDGESVLLEFSLGEERSFLWLVSRGSLETFELPGRRSIEALAREVYSSLTRPFQESPAGETWEDRRRRLQSAHDEYVRRATLLSEMLVGEAVRFLDSRRLLVVGHGALQYLPFGALPVPGLPPAQGEEAGGDWTPMVSRYEVVQLPSASVVASLRTEPSARTGKKLLVFADPVFDASDPRVRGGWSPFDLARGEATAAELASAPLSRQDLGGFRRLPFTRYEAEAITRGMSAADLQTSLGFDASLARFTGSELASFRYLHFATHAVTRPDRPELSSVVFSLVDDRGRPQEGFLRLYDIFDLDLEAELVVLSACETALGREVRGEGLIGLTRGFLYAGARQVLASLWKVEDRATAELMARLYESMLEEGEPPSTALRQAQVAMWEDGRPPYYWAAFVLQGDWR